MDTTGACGANNCEKPRRWRVLAAALMRARLGRLVAGACVAGVAALAGPAAAAADQRTQSFATPGQQYTWTVPAQVTEVHVDAFGAAGGMDAGANGCVAGRGGEVRATVAVTPGETLTLTVGGAGGNASGSQGGAAGSAAGGAGGTPGATQFALGGGGGGGGSFIGAPGAALVVAGGGGGCGGFANGSAGDGGNAGVAGQNAQSAQGGGAGAPTAAGAGGASAPATDPPGSAANSQTGGAGAGTGVEEFGGGGGGGGYFGGGGGGGAALGVGTAGGGGGGSDFVIASATGVTETSGTDTGNGHITLTYDLPGTTIGQVFTPPRNYLKCCSPFLATSPLYTARSNGVITAWSFQSDASPPTTLKFLVGRATGTPTYYTTVASSAADAIVANKLNTYLVRIPVQAGDVIGLYTEAGDFYADTSSQADRVAAGPLGEQPVGTSTSYTPDRFAQLDGRYAVGAILDVSAQVEPDVDADGFGDVSQDACPGVAGSVQGCPHADLSVTQSASAASLLAGGPVTYALRVANGGPDAAPRVVVTESLPAGARLVSAIASTGTCSGTTTLSCDVGALATGADATVTVTVALPSPGTTVSTARVDSPTLDADQATAPGSGDTNAGNNTATATVTVTPAPSGGGGVPAPSPARPTMPPFAGVTLRAQTITLTRGTAQAPLFSPVAAAGRLTLSTTVTVPAPAREARGHKHRSRRKTVVVGVASFALVAGKLTLVPVHLTHAAMALLRSHHALQALASVVATDDLHATRTTRAKLTLKQGKKP